MFTCSGSIAKGRKMLADLSKIMLRAYYAEADNCVRSLRSGKRQRRQAAHAADRAARGTRPPRWKGKRRLCERSATAASSPPGPCWHLNNRV